MNKVIISICDNKIQYSYRNSYDEIVIEQHENKILAMSFKSLVGELKIIIKELFYKFEKIDQIVIFYSNVILKYGQRLNDSLRNCDLSLAFAELFKEIGFKQKNLTIERTIDVILEIAKQDKQLENKRVTFLELGDSLNMTSVLENGYQLKERSIDTSTFGKMYVDGYLLETQASFMNLKNETLLSTDKHIEDMKDLIDIIRTIPNTRDIYNRWSKVIMVTMTNIINIIDPEIIYVWGKPFNRITLDRNKLIPEIAKYSKQEIVVNVEIELLKYSMEDIHKFLINK